MPSSFDTPDNLLDNESLRLFLDSLSTQVNVLTSKSQQTYPTQVSGTAPTMSAVYTQADVQALADLTNTLQQTLNTLLSVLQSSSV